jgi:hypothetical protein
LRWAASPTDRGRGLTLAADLTSSRWSRTALDDVPQGALLTSRPPIEPETGARRAPTYSDLNFFDA